MEMRPDPVFRQMQEVVLIGTMAVYDSQTQASMQIPLQWRSFRRDNPKLGSSASFYGASPCTGDQKIHYLTGIPQGTLDIVPPGERLVLQAGEYAVVLLHDPALLRQTWMWLLSDWLPASRWRERNAPEFERFTSISEAGMPVGPVELCIPIEPLRN